MSRSHSAVIDLTEESPPAHGRPRPPPPPALRSGTHILDWSSNAPHAAGPSSHGTTPNPAAPPNRSPAVHAPIVVGSDDEDDDNSFTITGGSEPVRRSRSLQRSFSSGTASATRMFPYDPSTLASSLRFHDDIGRGPHGAGSRIPQSIGVLGSSSSPRHPLHPQRRAALPSASTTTARRSGGSTTTTATATSDANLASRLGGDFSFGNFGFGPTYGMELIGSLLRGWHPNGHGSPQQNAERKVPQKFDPKWTHPYEPQPGFTHSIIEPPVDLDTYFDDKAVVTGPLPDTTPICACCRFALVTGANGDERIWALPCGHVIDGRCVDRLSGLAPVPSPETAATGTSSKAKGKAKAIEATEDEPPAKVTKTSARTRAAASLAAPTDATPKNLKKPKRFECPVEGCKQKCTKEPNSKYSAWEVFV
ncbi:Zinc finger, RING/FYVE/PHD-type [Kalmanozyma brasiliensis GHG001]|uniref:Zinc finger, RING/FYVE/PHD-type n=1 Tax=Kalmanozyma brasiliensis (strain GHG001) TaxID=1365824 RepID=UPI0028680431|nr:Zinc finger, RING/FYVE/PHD-type [Kalmanozyma brasiliensis GHG001]KAF6767375.1 Zinc finger, RING/FYVE/PHD-type [Kalmanozyma brasiliensis GHG001]